MTQGRYRRIPMPVWEGLLKSCGLRRAELEHLRVGDITQDQEGHIWLHIAQSDESPARDVPVLGPALRKKPGHRQLDKCGPVLPFGSSVVLSYRRSWIIGTVFDGIPWSTVPITPRTGAKTPPIRRV